MSESDAATVISNRDEKNELQMTIVAEGDSRITVLIKNPDDMEQTSLGTRDFDEHLRSVEFSSLHPAHLFIAKFDTWFTNKLQEFQRTRLFSQIRSLALDVMPDPNNNYRHLLTILEAAQNLEAVQLQGTVQISLESVMRSTPNCSRYIMMIDNENECILTRAVLELLCEKRRKSGSQHLQLYVVTKKSEITVDDLFDFIYEMSRICNGIEPQLTAFQRSKMETEKKPYFRDCSTVGIEVQSLGSGRPGSFYLPLERFVERVSTFYNPLDTDFEFSVGSVIFKILPQRWADLKPDDLQRLRQRRETRLHVARVMEWQRKQRAADEDQEVEEKDLYDWMPSPLPDDSEDEEFNEEAVVKKTNSDSDMSDC
ncbi:unnamed protein product [Caenorhabditis auriculariae]|uniref:Uncharacterized protein n=1 Tax=Caenorhabditis auriculariae TaxID=2777116 RepID=A0A8S1HNN7_9PELO|nr:unnamed protein product [Caenorhabditis auriculariae]